MTDRLARERGSKRTVSFPAVLRLVCEDRHQATERKGANRHHKEVRGDEIADGNQHKESVHIFEPGFGFFSPIKTTEEMPSSPQRDRNIDAPICAADAPAAATRESARGSMERRIGSFM
jgi:hypothetical protein